MRVCIKEIAVELLEMTFGTEEKGRIENLADKGGWNL